VRVFKIRTNRHTHRNPGDSNAKWFQQPRQIVRSRFTLGVRISGKDYLFYFFPSQSLQQILDSELIGADPANWGERAVQHVIQPPVFAGLFYRHLVVRLFHDQDNAPVALRVRAEAARVNIGDVIADGAEDDFIFDILNGLNESVGLLAFSSEDVKRETLGGLGADARHLLKLVDEL